MVTNQPDNKFDEDVKDIDTLKCEFKELDDEVRGEHFDVYEYDRVKLDAKDLLFDFENYQRDNGPEDVTYYVDVLKMLIDECDIAEEIMNE